MCAVVVGLEVWRCDGAMWLYVWMCVTVHGRVCKCSEVVSWLMSVGVVWVVGVDVGDALWIGIWG